MPTIKKDLYQGTSQTRGVQKPSDSRATRAFHVKGLSSSGRSGLNEAINTVQGSISNQHPDDVFLPLRTLTATSNLDGTAHVFATYARNSGGYVNTGNADKLAHTEVRYQSINWWAQTFAYPTPDPTAWAVDDEADLNIVHNVSTGRDVATPIRVEIPIVKLYVDTVLTASPYNNANVHAMFSKINLTALSFLGYSFPKYTLRFDKPIVYSVQGGDGSISYYTRYVWSFRADGWFYSFAYSATKARKRLMYDAATPGVFPYQAP